MRYFMTVAALMIGTFVCKAEVPAALLAERQKENSMGSPTIAISREGVRVKITFAGTLQSADAVSGPWNSVSNATSPFEENPASLQRFYRTREPVPESIFSSRSV